jgi:four helix bundle protein
LWLIVEVVWVSGAEKRAGGGASFRDLLAWQGTVVLAKGVYEVTATWPKSEQFGLTNQARRAAVFVPANIAEGQGRGMPNEFRQFLRYAYGSLCELETHLGLGVQLGFLPDQHHQSLVEQSTAVARMLRGLMRSELRTTHY